MLGGDIMTELAQGVNNLQAKLAHELCIPLYLPAWHLHAQSMNHISPETGSPRFYAKSPTVQDAC